MNTEQKGSLNRFFIETFNKILYLEERAVLNSGCKNLSIRELHIIEAVSELEQTKDNTMSKIAKRLLISVGALTTAINVLVKKSYVKRGSMEEDRRVVLIYLTDKGRLAEKIHSDFHNNMIESVGEYMDDKSLDNLIESLEKLRAYFNQEMRKVK